MATAATQQSPATVPAPAPTSTSTSTASTVVPTSRPAQDTSLSEEQGPATEAPPATAPVPEPLVAAPSTEPDQPPSLAAPAPAAPAPAEPSSAAATAALQQAHYAQYGPGDLQGLLPEVIDSDIFAQLLEMDDDEDEDEHEFSKGIVWNYFEQAESTFDKMDEALATSDLGELSTLGHFLKGSSAAVGVNKVRDSCECMQQYGKMHDADGISQLSQQEAVEKLTSALREVKVQYKEAEIVLKRFYDDD
ncbi:unnamed protein product [Tilletia controversa]|uniref:HPt domain-containing protein n=3 Tax=Tilletia TaxID=13289 RepID=A0A8X7MPJ9_9BASI|nr:hypothetical protein CF336_g5973 [Tilletia laevis]KAE8196438.1 hypothetical protein CF328_g4135 [Tilletia controversa]KAE8242604.1 hypothetical protein A4X03_0g8000 [Tilletia caries]KAE8193546.1 hypothetical protein CF335_g5559 [Tilletia laevis]KAE8243990.1 hypothetical protein A4X06_0g6022 [Tilletia controversa]